MTRNGRLSIIVFAIMSLSACAKLPGKVAEPATPAAKTNAKAAAPDMHSSQMALDWAGTYVGTLPCADCPGVRETLVLHKDQTYALSTHYVDRPGSAFSRSNSFTWVNGHTIRLEGMQQPMYFRVGENQLIQLGIDGQPITGPLAAKMVLKKTQTGKTQ
jgi:Uncharacterized lipoprotein NlpE involved in copper resistance